MPYCSRRAACGRCGVVRMAWRGMAQGDKERTDKQCPEGAGRGALCITEGRQVDYCWESAALPETPPPTRVAWKWTTEWGIRRTGEAAAVDGQISVRQKGIVAPLVALWRRASGPSETEVFAV